MRQITVASMEGIIRRSPHASHPNGAHQHDRATEYANATADATNAPVPDISNWNRHRSHTVADRAQPQNTTTPPFGENHVATKNSSNFDNRGVVCAASFR